MRRPEQLLQQQVEHFWNRVDKSTGADACWPWTKAKSNNGYGKTKFGGRASEYTHRIAYRLEKGDIGLGLVVRHDCDNRLCCNPAHLQVGSHGDNARDAIIRGRHVAPPRFQGERHPRAKLTRAIVDAAIAAHASGVPAAVLARGAGVGETTMSHALAGRTWRRG